MLTVLPPHRAAPSVMFGFPKITASAETWRYFLLRPIVLNPFVELLSTVLVGVVVYVGLVFRRKPPVVTELANVLQETSCGAAQWLGHHLPHTTENFSQLEEFKPGALSRQ